MRKLNRALDDLRAQAEAVAELGVSVGAQTFGGSLSLAQLVVYLDGRRDVADFAGRIDARGGSVSLNPLFELRLLPNARRPRNR